MTRQKRCLLSVVSALVGLCAGIAGSEAVFGRLRDASASRPLLFSVELRDESGSLLASPLLVGEEGRKLHLDLSQPDGVRSEPLRMSLDLDPRETDAQNLCIEYRVSLEEGTPQQGRLAMAFGERRSVRVDGSRESLRLDVVVARAGSKEFSRILDERRRGLI
jgi:hypothetical protein